MAWIEFPAPDASPKLAELTRRWRDKQLPIPGVIEVMMPRAGSLDAVLVYCYGLTFGASSLGRLREEIIATVVSGINRCYYCTIGHANYLRSLWPGRDETFVDYVRAMWTLGGSCRELPPTEAVAAARLCMAELTDVSDADKLMARYAAQLTIASHAVTRADLDELRAVGFDDVGILDIAQISGCFAHMNRIASGLGVTVRSNPELACELLGEAEWERQQRR